MGPNRGGWPAVSRGYKQNSRKLVAAASLSNTAFVCFPYAVAALTLPLAYGMPLCTLLALLCNNIVQGRLARGCASRSAPHAPPPQEQSEVSMHESQLASWVLAWYTVIPA